MSLVAEVSRSTSQQQTKSVRFEDEQDVVLVAVDAFVNEGRSSSNPFLVPGTMEREQAKDKKHIHIGIDDLLNEEDEEPVRKAAKKIHKHGQRA